MRHDVHIHAMRAYFSDGSSQILPHHGLLEDGHTTPAFQLCRYRANLDRLEVTHQSAFNLEGPGWLEVWALQNGG